MGEIEAEGEGQRRCVEGVAVEAKIMAIKSVGVIYAFFVRPHHRRHGSRVNSFGQKTKESPDTYVCINAKRAVSMEGGRLGRRLQSESGPGTGAGIAIAIAIVR